MKKWLFRSGVVLAGATITTTLLLVAALGNAKVEATPSGVHTRLLIPLLLDRSVAIPIYGGSSQQHAAVNYLEGPIVKVLPSGNWTARWLCENTVVTKKGNSARLTISCVGKTHSYLLRSSPKPNAETSMPAELTVLSDIEGNSEFLESALTELNVTDRSGDWIYGKGHLIILGDSVDRGRNVFAVLWKLRNLAIQAERAGGVVHFVIGNHEQYILRNNISRANPEHIFALNKLGGYRYALAPDTVLGQWLREQPVAVKLGRTVFVHGGISDRVVQRRLPVQTLNQAMLKYWKSDTEMANSTPALDSIFGVDGITQYRGFVAEVPQLYPMADQRQVQLALKYFDAERFVVAHTPVDAVKPLYDGAVYAVNVNDPMSKQAALTIKNSVPIIIPLKSSRRLELKPKLQHRTFNLLDGNDWSLLYHIFTMAKQLSAIPHPY
jgi:Calcineurin-like phosphoesterase